MRLWHQSMRIFFAATLLLLTVNTAICQRIITCTLRDSITGKALEGVTVIPVAAPKSGTVSNDSGIVRFAVPVADTTTISFSRIGYLPRQLVVTTTTPNEVLILLAPTTANTLGDVIIVASTRSNDRIENATTKVEVLGPSEMNEESTLKPGNVASLLGDLSGVQIQQSSAASGNANVRILGLEGKYTQILRDGMPLYGGYSGGFGILSIPPLDLRQMELIKGSASTLYGGGAIAGLVNLVSKRPGYDADATLLANQTTLQETNLNAYYAKRNKTIGVTLFAGQQWQKEVDVDKDGFSDVARSNSTLLHPTVFFYPGANSSVSLGWTGNFDQRTGGDMLAIDGKNDAAHPYYEENRFNRNTLTLMGDTRLGKGWKGYLKSSLSLFSRKETTNTYRFDGNQNNFYGEASALYHGGAHNINTGITFVGEYFTPSEATPVPVGQTTNNTLGVFAQDTWQIFAKTKLETGLRIDHHFTSGNFVLPRIALFQHLSEAWGARLGFGMGYMVPNALTPQLKDYSIYQIQPIAPTVEPEHSWGANLEVNYKYEFGEENSLFINQAFFATQVNKPVIGTENSQGQVSYANATGPVLTAGSDTYVQATLGHWEIYLGYTYTSAQRQYLSQNKFMVYTPRHRAATTLLYELEDSWRIGLEASFTGQQYRDDATTTPGYLFMAGMIEKIFGPRWSLVLNCENLLDERQSRHESLYTGSIASPQFKTLWAPIDGRVANLCVRFKPFAAN